MGQFFQLSARPSLPGKLLRPSSGSSPSAAGWEELDSSDLSARNASSVSLLQRWCWSGIWDVGTQQGAHQVAPPL